MSPHGENAPEEEQSLLGRQSGFAARNYDYRTLPSSTDGNVPSRAVGFGDDMSPHATAANSTSDRAKGLGLGAKISSLFGFAKRTASEKNGFRESVTDARHADTSPTKLGTFNGVFVPTILNVLSVLMFLRFGFILGQAGILAMVGMLVACYIITTVTTMSISAIATNGTVRGGGAYYLISRSLGPEFGGSIGIVLYIGFTFNTGMNAVGLTDCLRQAWGVQSGNWSHWLPDSYWYLYLWSSIILLACVLICLAGSNFFARCSNVLLILLLVATFSIPITAMFRQPFENTEQHINYTGLSFLTLKQNLLPNFTKGAAGSQLHGRENLQDLFGILFPATASIFAGASMSGDLRKPSKSIPKGTLWGLLLTFIMYTIVIVCLGASVARPSFYHNVNVIQDVSLSGSLILLGEFAAAFFSVLMGVLGSAKLLQAVAKDRLVPGLSIFAKGFWGRDEPLYATFFTYLLAQLTLFADINEIASLVTMTYLMTFLGVNLACFLLKISSAPNFRPSFHYFRWWTAFGGTILSGVTMFLVDGVYASACVAILLVLFVSIHFTTTPKPWGDVSQSLIYHQVRKYLLRLRQEHVKFWRPQILLFVNDPRRSYKLIQFCNSLKKGSLFILGHVIVTNDFAGSVEEARKQQSNWTRYIDFSKIKAFVNVVMSTDVEWGTRNVVLSAGLGGMRPNIIVLGFYNLDEYRETQPAKLLPSLPQSRPTTPVSGEPKKKRRSHEDRMKGELPTDTNRPEKAVSPTAYVTVLEDLLLRLRTNVAIARGFNNMDLPLSESNNLRALVQKLREPSYGNDENGQENKRYIDLWPIQMTAEIQASNESHDHLFSSNFDTYALILQLGCILHTVSSWKRACNLRVSVFVEYESDVEEERGRVELLLNKLRIEAEVRVFWLASGKLKTYELLVNGTLPDADYDTVKEELDAVLQDEEWWQEVQEQREQSRPDTDSLQPVTSRSATNLSSMSEVAFSATGTSLSDERFERLGRMLRRKAFQPTMGGLSKLGVNFSMQTQRLDPKFVDDPESESSSDESGTTSEGETDGTDDDRSILFASSRNRSRRASIVSQNDIERYEFEDSPTSPPSKHSSRRATIAEMPLLPPSPRVSRPVSRQAVSLSTSSDDESLVHDAIATQDHAEQRPLLERTKSTPTASFPGSSTPKDGQARLSRPPTIRQKSVPKLSSNLMPRTTVSSDDGPGPSIMFQAQSPPSRSNRIQSIYDRSDSQRPRRPSVIDERSTSAHSNGATSSIGRKASNPSFGDVASGYPGAQSSNLNFNALPCRAQHIVLNELMRRKSSHDKTAVIFTTLPAPAVGTCESEADSIRYLGDLETLCNGLPPVLMVHSNSVTVTTSL